jgi:NTE family protein
MAEPVQQPVSVVDVNTDATAIEDGIALCLSGGGYRAMVFHLGALIRLNEIGLLQKLNRVSSVSGGSITSATLGLKWRELQFKNGFADKLVEHVVNPIRSLAERTIDADSIIGGILMPGVSISDKIVKAYRKFLFGDNTLQNLPDDTQGLGPRFVINATNVQSGALWRFSRPYMGDYQVGRVLNPQIPVAVAVAASSAFPPILSPLVMELQQAAFVADPRAVLQKAPFTTEVVLSDGGVYDNLGLETAWKRYKSILVSDGGGKMPPEPEPKRDWARHALRINDIIDNQVRSLRKRQLIQAFETDTEHNGTYWGIRSHLKDYSLTTGLNCPEDRIMELTSTPTRLKRLEPEYQNRLINWGYAICAAATTTHFPGPIKANIQFPYSGGV